jgi:hypothetical protein
LHFQSLLALLSRASTWEFFDFFKTSGHRLSLAYVTSVYTLRVS